MISLFILLNESNEKNEIAIKYPIDEEKEEGHLDKCIKFNEDYNLNIENIDNMTSHEVALTIANLGYPNIHVCGEIILIYLPSFLNEEQNRWFKNNKKFLSKFSLNVVSIQIDGTIKDLSHSKNRNYSCKFRDLKKELKKKELIKEKMRLEEYKNIKKLRLKNG